VRQGSNAADSADLLLRADDLYSYPESEKYPGWEVDPDEPHHNCQVSTRKFEGVIGEKARNTAARANSGEITARVELDVEKITYQGGNKKQQEPAHWPHVAFHRTTENDQEVEIGDQMPGTDMQKKRGEKGQAKITPRLVRNQAELLDDRVRLEEGGNTHHRDNKSHDPGCPCGVRSGSRIEFDRQAE